MKNANIWRLTGDFWDVWDKLYEMFEKTENGIRMSARAVDPTAICYRLAIFR